MSDQTSAIKALGKLEAYIYLEEADTSSGQRILKKVQGMMQEITEEDSKMCRLCNGTGTTYPNGVPHACISCGGEGEGDKW